MFDIGWQELFILAVLAIIVIGPKDLPRAIKTITQWIRKARSMARDLQDGLDEVVREAELDDIKKEANKIMDGEGIDPKGALADEFDMSDIEKDWSDTVDDLRAATDPGAKDTKQTKDPVTDDVIDDIAGLDDDPALAEPKTPAEPQPGETAVADTPATEAPAPETAQATPKEPSKEAKG